MTQICLAPCIHSTAKFCTFFLCNVRSQSQMTACNHDSVPSHDLSLAASVTAVSTVTGLGSCWKIGKTVASSYLAVQGWQTSRRSVWLTPPCTQQPASRIKSKFTAMLHSSRPMKSTACHTSPSKTSCKGQIAGSTLHQRVNKSHAYPKVRHVCKLLPQSN